MRSFGILITAVLALGLVLAPRVEAGEPVAVIVNNLNPIDSLSRDDIRRIYTNNLLKWPDGVPIILYDLAIKDPVRQTFSIEVIGRPAGKIAEEWAHLKITNQAKNPPLTVKSQLLIIKRVSMEKGAIGYVSLGAVKDRDTPGIKIVTVIK